MISDFGYILLFIIGSVAFLCVAYLTSFLVRPDRPNYEKLTTYECGEEPVGNAWARFNIRFYIIALVFVLFDVEIVFLFPWAVVFGNENLIAETNGLWGWFSVAEMLIFIGVLALGLAYVWRKGFLDWVKPEVKPKDIQSKIPASAYDKINKKYAGKKVLLED
ncbi:NADH-quinone oxidoreductase subunit A [Flammeovirgaceae bacterium SG7u.111]|nr:NADH-quinone oxidoreductase subunit A [Flammeovirgaceae bacterium SG7u.132]WPO35770.1 NADH-quinone oxidoreductase subunit A [Flammeovirgaceae bacterium SG7u.111]